MQTGKYYPYLFLVPHTKADDSWMLSDLGAFACYLCSWLRHGGLHTGCRILARSWLKAPRLKLVPVQLLGHRPLPGPGQLPADRLLPVPRQMLAHGLLWVPVLLKPPREIWFQCGCLLFACFQFQCC
jgi:hypothetical protein